MKLIKLICLILLIPKLLLAQELQGSFQDWSVFKAKRSDKTICYMTSIPIKRIGDFQNNIGEPFFLVTNIVNNADEISVSFGFYYKEKSNVEISFGSQKFYLFPYKSTAWANDENEDINIIKQMKKNDDLVISAVSDKNKVFKDTYSLIGFSKAYLKMKQSCK